MIACRLLLPLSLITGSAAFGQTAEQLEYFEKNVRPVLVANCQPCHNAKTKSSGLDLTSAAGFTAGGAGGALVARDQLESSELLRVIGYEDSLKMPPMGKLKPEAIESLTNWVKMGAPWPGADLTAAVVAPTPKKEFTEEQKSFWAFQAVKDPAVPKVKNSSWVKTPVDAFILAKLEEKGLKPAPPATKTALLRRVTFDLTGLPPTEEEISDFLADNSPKAFEKVVDRLLDSPRYGERWGRHWLDVARYADSTGNDEDHRYPYAWRYRDYVIAAFNNDMPYDRFVREQIAGDLLAADPHGEFNPDSVVATGFLALGAKALAQVDKKKMLYDVWDEQVDVTSRAFLGMTMACARCHDHKFDPILTKDYYSMVGMFASTRSFEKANQGVASLLYRPLIPESEFKEYQAYQAKVGLVNLEAEELIDAVVQKTAEQASMQLAEYMLAARSVYADGMNAKAVAKEKGLELAVLNKWVKLLTAKPVKGSTDKPFLDEWEAASGKELAEVAVQYQRRYQAELAKHFTVAAKANVNARKRLETGDPTKQTVKNESKDPFFNAVFNNGGGPFVIAAKDREKLLTDAEWEQVYTIRGNAAALKKQGPPDPDMADAVSEDKPVRQKILMRGDYNSPGDDAPLGVPAILAKVEPAPASFSGSGRLEVANWIASAENPMTARVMVNRLWMWHYGEGIVATPDNFGKMGARPTHPELLDYLASRFVEGGWSVKKMQRMMVLSNAYQMSSDADEKTTAADPENALISRFNRQRLDVEEIRDGMLAIDGTIDLTMGGTLQKGTGTDSENSAGRLSLNPETLKRRTVYLPLRRSNLPTLLNLYDFGDATTVNGKRALTNVAPQALFMMNSEFVLQRAKNITTALLEDATLTDRERMQQMFLKALDRKPEPEEVDAGFTYMSRFKEKFNADNAAAWQSFFHILLTSNEFIYIE